MSDHQLAMLVKDSVACSTEETFVGHTARFTFFFVLRRCEMYICERGLFY